MTNLAAMYKWLIIVFGLMVFNSASAQNQLRVNDTLPMFSANTFTNDTFTLDSVLPHYTVFVFWATWNSPSLELLDELNQNYKAINPTRRNITKINIEVVDISLDVKPDIYRINIKRENWPWEHHINDFLGWDSPLIDTLGITQIPTVFIVDKYRKIIVINPDINQLRNTLSNIKLNAELSN
ncbi:MAG: thioredoxin family protein [Bacteroidia bacterium]|nr:thioredoxin family protein [Bacteroidia bacterium]